ncbi:MAG: GTPase Era [Spirochaetaceae bacterium]|jgi:GTP-binding protein Era|nr:GTPase Era [Spirochaetaceae bacterium]
MDREPMTDRRSKAAFVAVVGRPSVGKSTLVNLLCGNKVAIVSPVPQTTRNAIRGIINRPQGQLVFVDTPGMHVSEKKLNQRLLDVANRSVEESELVLYVLDASRIPGAEEEAIAGRLSSPSCMERTLAVINKMDAPEADFQRIRNFLDEKLPRLSPSRCFQVSALKNTGVEAVVECLFDIAPPGEPFYPEEYYTDQDVSFRIAEIIREKAINRLRQELPHSIYVEVADTELTDGEKRLWVRAFILTERESQKGMVVGKGGEVIKAIGMEARKDLNRIFDWKVDLDLRVKTAKDWRHNDRLLRRIIDR